MEVFTFMLISTAMQVLWWAAVISSLYAYLKTRSRAVLLMLTAFIASFVLNIILFIFLSAVLYLEKLAPSYAALAARLVFTILIICGILLLKKEMKMGLKMSQEAAQ
jgi:uncharacterized BrkB/YihY/UPF0761 family membrane protein